MNKDTIFPNAHSIGWKTLIYDYEDIQAWFKRCLEDLPNPEMHYGLLENWGDYQKWYETWFSQFEEKSKQIGEESIYYEATDLAKQALKELFLEKKEDT